MTPTDFVLLSVLVFGVIFIITTTSIRASQNASALNAIRNKSAHLLVKKTVNQNMSIKIFNETEQSLMGLIGTSIIELEFAGKHDRVNQIKWLYRTHIARRNESAKTLNIFLRENASLTETMFKGDFPAEPDGDLIKLERTLFLEHVNTERLKFLQPKMATSEDLPVK